MTSKTLSDQALSVISLYRNFTAGAAGCNIPYYNNKYERLRAALRAQAGKGSPQEILDEAEHRAAAKKVKLQALDSTSLKKFLVDNNIGIDCSGLAYYILKAENKHVRFSYPYSKGVLGFLRAKFRPIENLDVATLASDENTKIISLKETLPGDLITMVGGPEGSMRDHVLTIHQIDFRDDVPAAIYYTHTVAWPSDGEYGHGVRQGLIKITNPDKSLTDQEWIEAEKTGVENYTFTRAQKSKTEIRRIK